MKNHFFKTKLEKIGIWSLLPLDSETWHGVNTSRYFKKLFGIPKGILFIHTLEDGYQHAYCPRYYYQLLHRRIKQITGKDYKGLAKKLKTFYGLVPKAKRAVAKKVNPAKFTNIGLAKHYLLIRDWIQHIAIYDQFGWIGEEYWPPRMEKILIEKLKLKKNSPEYNRLLFTLTKPEEVSTTLKEKMAVAYETLRLKKKKTTMEKAAKKLASSFGYLPVFTFGDAWQAKHYQEELSEKLKKPPISLRQEYEGIKNYKTIRAKEIKRIVTQYKISPRDLQLFIDFGLVIDTRNEAEYFVSFGSFYLMPLYFEIAKRLFISVRQLRSLTEDEMIKALTGKADVAKILHEKGKFVGWGFDLPMKKRLDFTAKESEKLFKYIESYVKPMQGNDEKKGICANPGKVVGKVRIVPTPKENSKVKNGDILITYATTTDYLPAMKRAAAFITESGGLTCHAAVVSREFNVPCVVALKNAMVNFKDGDLVEVDADKGIIKKIN